MKTTNFAYLEIELQLYGEEFKLEILNFKNI